MTMASPSPMSVQRQRFNHLFWRLIDAFLNRLFDLRPQVATFRLWAIIFLFLFSGFVISLFYYPLSVWLWHIQDIFGYLLNPNYIQNYPGDPFYNLAFYAYTAFTDPRVLQYLPIFLAPFFIALQTAANYLADVFELEDPRVARRFVQAVALTGSNELIRISKGNVLEDDKNSPVYLIGGPGRVLVDMDSAALFERPDGTPRVIPDNGNVAGRMVRLDGFERFRQAVDLRPHVIELRDEDGRSAEIRGRSLDGIPVSATDVSFQFTVFRNGLLATAGNPYPFFNNSTIEGLVYKATSLVKPELANPSKFEPNWPGNMVGLIRGKLGSFMNEHKLTEYLASYGQPEVTRYNNRANQLTNAVSVLTNPADSDTPSARTITKPSFTSRDQLRLELFNLYADQFTNTQMDRGVELYWLGMGTWRVPIEIYPATGAVPEQHIEAWRISRENIRKESNVATGRYREETTVQTFASLIQEIPIAKPLSATTDDARKEAMKALLNAYRLQLIQAAEFMKARGRAVPEVIIQAIECINRALGITGWHWTGEKDPDNNCPPTDPFNGSDKKGPKSGGAGAIGFGTSSTGEFVPPDLGSSPFSGGLGPEQGLSSEWSEEDLYRDLLILSGMDEGRAERLIDLERQKFPLENRRKWVERARDHLLHDRGALH